MITINCSDEVLSEVLSLLDERYGERLTVDRVVEIEEHRVRYRLIGKKVIKEDMVIRIGSSPIFKE